MSEMDLNSMSPQALLAGFILSKRGVGLSLSPADHLQLHQWLKDCPNPDQLLSILDEVMPECPRTSARPYPLKFLDTRVRKRFFRQAN